MAKILTKDDLKAISRTLEPVIEKAVEKKVSRLIDTKIRPLIKETVKPMIEQTVRPMIEEAIDELAIITDKAIRKESEILRAELASKEDLKRYATKDDLQNAVTDIKNEMTTKEDLKQFATKHDLQDAVLDIKDEIRSVLGNHEQRITHLEAKSINL